MNFRLQAELIRNKSISMDIFSSNIRIPNTDCGSLSSVESVKTKKCKDCGIEKPETREFFGQYKNNSKAGATIGFRNSCRKCMAQATARHSAENPRSVNARNKRRQALAENAQGFYTDADIHIIRKELADGCRFCGKDLAGGGEVEHLTPISRGGSNYPHNLTLSCLGCNREKTNKTLNEYMDWRRERELSIRNISPPTENPDVPTLEKGRKAYVYDQGET